MKIYYHHRLLSAELIRYRLLNYAAARFSENLSILSNMNTQSVSAGLLLKPCQNYYFSISDVRHFSNDMMMVRTAKDFNDYRGGSNNWIKMEKGLFKKFFNIN